MNKKSRRDTFCSPPQINTEHHEEDSKLDDNVRD